MGEPGAPLSRRDLTRWALLAGGSASLSALVARVALPQRVPYGFHGAWIPG